jgi:hypothetical protein
MEAPARRQAEQVFAGLGGAAVGTGSEPFMHGSDSFFVDGNRYETVAEKRVVKKRRYADYATLCMNGLAAMAAAAAKLKLAENHPRGE